MMISTRNLLNKLFNKKMKLIRNFKILNNKFNKNYLNIKKMIIIMKIPNNNISILYMLIIINFNQIMIMSIHNLVKL